MPAASPTFTLRPYQQEAVDATIAHFRRHTEPAVIVLPTGAGKFSYRRTRKIGKRTRTRFSARKRVSRTESC